MASLLSRSPGGWQRRDAFLSAASFLRSRGALLVAGRTHYYPRGGAPPSRCVSRVPARGNFPDRLPSSALSQRLRLPNLTWCKSWLQQPSNHRCGIMKARFRPSHLIRASGDNSRWSGNPNCQLGRHLSQLAKHRHIAHRPRIGPILNECHQYGA